jgi:hypothetical protein
VGASSFRCDLAIRAPGEQRFRMAVLIDSEWSGAHEELDDRYRLKPAVLRAFGWDLRYVLTRDWVFAREATLQRILDALGPIPATSAEA